MKFVLRKRGNGLLSTSLRCAPAARSRLSDTCKCTPKRTVVVGSEYHETDRLKAHINFLDCAKAYHASTLRVSSR